MSRRRVQAAHNNRERWLVSYADFITLLFAFFVVLYASSQVDKPKMGKLASAIEGAFQQLGVFQVPATPTAMEWQKQDGMQVTAQERNEALRRELERALAEEIRHKEVDLRMGPEGLVLSLREVGFFDSGSALLKTRAEPAISRIANVLRPNPVAIRIEGHTDNVPIHTAQFTSNWELSTARATEVIKVLITRYDFSPDRLSAAGYSEFHAISSNDTAEGRRQNRRVDIVILGLDRSGRHNVVDENERN